jgi:hypothetical protein
MELYLHTPHTPSSMHKATVLYPYDIKYCLPEWYNLCPELGIQNNNTGSAQLLMTEHRFTLT